MRLVFGSALLCATLACAVAVPASAHHSFAAYDLAVTKAVSGTLREFDWNAPHSAVTVAYQGADGKPSEITVITTAPNMIVRQGFNAKDFKAGQKVDLTWHPNRNGLEGGELVELKLEDGRSLKGATFGPPPGADGPPGAPPPGAPPAGGPPPGPAPQ